MLQRYQEFRAWGEPAGLPSWECDAFPGYSHPSSPPCGFPMDIHICVLIWAGRAKKLRKKMRQIERKVLEVQIMVVWNWVAMLHVPPAHTAFCFCPVNLHSSNGRAGGGDHRYPLAALSSSRRQSPGLNHSHLEVMNFNLQHQQVNKVTRQAVVVQDLSLSSQACAWMLTLPS